MMRTAERMYLKITKSLNDEHQDLLVSLEAYSDGTYDLTKVIFSQVDQESGKEAWAVLPLNQNPTYIEAMTEDIIAEIERAKSANETKKPEYQKLLRYTRGKMILQDY